MFKKSLIRHFKIFAAIFYYLLVVCPMIVSAAQVTLQWDANNPGPEGYRVHQRISGQGYDYSNAVWTGTATTCTIENLSEDVTYFYVVRAFDGDDSSGDSNEVSFTASSSDPDNLTPDSPIITAPIQGATTGTDPVVSLDNYLDPDGDIHLSTQYQISLDEDFSLVVFNRTSEIYLTALTIPDLILDPDSTYYLRVRFFDARNGASQWSEIRTFYTSDYSSNGDTNANGVLDDQEIDTYTDLDGNGIDDQLQADILTLNVPDKVNPQVAVKAQDINAQVVAARGYQSSGLGLASSVPATMTGLVCFKLYLEDGVDTTRVTIHLTTPAPEDGTWYKFDIEQGWFPYPSAEFSADRQTVTLLLEDGGMGDQDGVRNGVIVDPAGLAYTSSQSGGSAAASNDTTANGGCFIGASQGEQLNHPISVWVIFALLICAGLLGCLASRKKVWLGLNI